METDGGRRQRVSQDYEDVAARYVWKTAKESLPPLREAVAAELSRGV
jgi:uncharacterized protein with HEPN domain